jgi:hypothetical protein
MIEMLVGAGVFAAGWLVGRANRKPKPTTGEPVIKAICGCTHQIGDHTDRTGRCNNWYRPMGTTSWMNCPCKVYSGPELITSYTSTGVVTLPPATEE